MATTKMKSSRRPVKAFAGVGEVHPSTSNTTPRKSHGAMKIAAPRGRTSALSHEMFLAAFKADQLEVVHAVKRGVQPIVLEYVAGSMRVSKDKLMQTLGLPRATMQRKASKQEPLSADESSRVYGITRLIGQVQAMVNESGNPVGFDAAQWVAAWLDQGLPALGDKTPAEFMDTAEGQLLVSRLLAQAQSGAYA